jgi:hypothetical protein
MLRILLRCWVGQFCEVYSPYPSYRPTIDVMLSLLPPAANPTENFLQMTQAKAQRTI